MEGAQDEQTFSGLAGGGPGGGHLDAVIDGIADDVGERILDGLDDRAVELGLLAFHHQLDLLAELVGDIADDTGEFGPDITDGLHAGFHHALLQFGGDDVQALRRVEQGGLLRFAGELENLVPGQNELADQIHQLVQLAHIDADGAVGDRGGGALGGGFGSRRSRRGHRFLRNPG